MIESPEEAERLDDGRQAARRDHADDPLARRRRLDRRCARATASATLRRPAADDICYATQNRQDAVKEIVARGRVADPRDRLADELERAAARRGRAGARRRGDADRRRERARSPSCSTATRRSASPPAPRRPRSSCRPWSPGSPSCRLRRPRRRSRSHARTSTSGCPREVVARDLRRDSRTRSPRRSRRCGVRHHQRRVAARSRRAGTATESPTSRRNDEPRSSGSTSARRASSRISRSCSSDWCRDAADRERLPLPARPAHGADSVP